MKIKVVSSIVLLLIFIPLLILGGLPFATLMAILAVASLYELLKTRRKVRKVAACIELFAYILVAFFTMNNFNSAGAFYMLDYRLMAFLILVNLAPLVFVGDKDKYNLTDALFLIGATLFIGLTFNLLVLIRGYNISYIIYIFLITTVTDTFAFLTGKYIGRRKLSPISPNKTVEGLIGGTLMGSFVAIMYYISAVSGYQNIGVVIFVTIFLSLLGQLGDLVFSFIKREFGKKDFSNIIPGHGGILDRLDSIIFVTLGFLLCMFIL